MDILFICKKRREYENEYGTRTAEAKPHLTFGLHNSAQFVVNFLNSHNVNAEVVTAVDANDIDRLVTFYDPKVVIIEAIWVMPAKFTELFTIPRHQKRKWVIRLHSRIGFIANEGIAFPWLKEYAKIPNLIVAPNTDEFTRDLAELFGQETVYLPNIYFTDDPEAEHHPRRRQHRTTIDVACFGAVRPMKNHLNQVVAAVKFAERHGMLLKFHINSTRCEQSGENVLKNIRAFFEVMPEHQLIEHEWLVHHDFVDLVKTMDLGMQVSFTETYNIVAADFVFNNIPIIGSSQITWLPKIFQADPNSTDDITNALERVWFGSIVGLQKMSKYSLMRDNAKAKRHWLDFWKKATK
jgi:hypothetical protein